ncbi:MAG: CoA ester lyase [Bacteroidetes bacterium]|nr:CoA ester lyase [Bacteroidota bacterium]MCL5025035.1 CoA ester lyase [Chloroflexota bacterium]
MVTIQERGVMAPIRSALFVPAHRDNLIPKALAAGADAIIMDLEDACPPPEKTNGRRVAREALETLDWGRVKATVRINGMDTALWPEDLDAIVCRQLYMVRVPKVETGEEIKRLDAVLGFLEARRGLGRGSLKIGVSLESPLGVLNAWGIANASPRVISMGGGGLDYHAEMHSEKRPDGMECLYLYSVILHVCYACGIHPAYTIYPAIHDVEGLIKDSEWARSMGFVGRACLHPKQVDPVNRVFGPSPEKVEWAKRVVAAIEEGREKRYGEITLDGVLIGPPTIIEVKRIYAMAGLELDPELG